MAGNKSKHPERRKQRVSENKKRKQRQSKKVRNDKNQRNDNVVVYKPPVNINLGLGIFVLLIGYLAIIIISYLKSKPITPYEVSMGSLAVNNTYTGVALREEVLVSADYSGYVNYYAREGEKVSKGTMIYTIDSTGKLSDVVGTDSTSENKLSDNDLFEIKSDISEFANSFDPINFNHTYNFKYDIEGTVLKLENYRVLSGIEKINSANYSDAVSFGYAPTSGVLVYAVDGYEQLKT